MAQYRNTNSQSQIINKTTTYERATHKYSMNFCILWDRVREVSELGQEDADDDIV